MTKILCNGSEDIWSKCRYSVNGECTANVVELMFALAGAEASYGYMSCQTIDEVDIKRDGVKVE